MNPITLHDLLSGRDTSLRARVVRAGLRAVEPIYTGMAAGRNRRFDHEKRPIFTLPRPVVSIGNLTTGGTGKTPMVIDIVQRLQHMGRHPAVLLRGYGAKVGEPRLLGPLPIDDGLGHPLPRGVNDEAMLFHQRLGPDVPIGICPDRYEAGEIVLRTTPKVDVFVLDDGFQHRQLHRDLDLVLIDATNPFGFGHVVPRGLMRESPHGLERADGIIMTRADTLDDDARQRLGSEISRFAGKPPVACTGHRWDVLLDEHDNERSLDDLAAMKVYIVTAIGNPQPFLDEVERRAAGVAGSSLFADHHLFTKSDAENVEQDATRANADALIMTEKDWVKFRAVRGDDQRRIVRPRLAMQFMDGEDSLDGMLCELLDQAGL